MSPLQRYAEAKKSGRFHPDTLKNWPEKDSPKYEEKPEEIRVNTKIESVEVKEQDNVTIFFWWLVVLTAWLLLLTFWKPDSKTETAKKFKEAPPVKIKYKTKVKKVYVAKSDDKWRRRFCYQTGDWEACRAYKTSLPYRARVMRKDLK